MPSINECLKEKNFFLKKHGSELYLPKDHDYYHQIQGQLFLSNRTLCYLVVQIEKDNVILKIKKDIEWEHNIKCILDFAKNYFLPLVFDYHIVDLDQ